MKYAYLRRPFGWRLISKIEKFWNEIRKGRLGLHKYTIHPKDSLIELIKTCFKRRDRIWNILAKNVFSRYIRYSASFYLSAAPAQTIRESTWTGARLVPVQASLGWSSADLCRGRSGPGLVWAGVGLGRCRVGLGRCRGEIARNAVIDIFDWEIEHGNKNAMHFKKINIWIFEWSLIQKSQ